MKATELRIGNYLPMIGIDIVTTFNGEEVNRRDSGGVIVVTADNFMDILKDIDRRQGIPLTEEWCLKFGFTKKEIGDISWFEKRIVGPFLISIHPKLELANLMIGGDNGAAAWRVKCEYVHRLQNLYHALTGEELSTSVGTK